MKLLDSEKSRGGLTLIEVLVVVWLIIILAAVLISAMTMLARPNRPPGVACVSHLKQVGLAFRVWANDHGDRFPWSVPQSNGGTFEFAMSTQIWRHFEIASNELNSPKKVVCPSDPGR